MQNKKIIIFLAFVTAFNLMHAYSIRYTNLTDQNLWIKATATYPGDYNKNKTKIIELKPHATFLWNHAKTYVHKFNYLINKESLISSLGFLVYDQPIVKSVKNIDPVYASSSFLDRKLINLENPTVYIYKNQKGLITASTQNPINIEKEKLDLEQEIQADQALLNDLNLIQ